MRVAVSPGRLAGTIRHRRRVVLLGLFSLAIAGLIGQAVFQQSGLFGDNGNLSTSASLPGSAAATSPGSETGQEGPLSMAPVNQPLPEFKRRRPVASVETGTRSPSEPRSDALTGEQETGNRLGPSTAREETEDPDTPERSISGAVLDDRGSLLSGVRVLARPVGLPGTGNSAGADFIQVTDALGGFHFDRLHTLGEYQLTVEESGDFHAGYLRVRSGVANAEIRLQRKRQIHVYGLVSDSDGRSLAGARVRALGSKHNVFTDSDGAYEFIAESLPGGQAPVLEFAHQDHRDLRRRVEPPGDALASEVRLDVQLEASGRQVAVVGRVVGPRGNMVGGVRVWLSSPEPGSYRRTLSSQWGEFHFDGIEPGKAFRLGVDAGTEYKSYVSEPFQVGPWDTSHDVHLRESDHAELSGRAVDPRGQPLGHFTLWLKTADVGSGARLPVTTDGAGYFRAEGIAAGPVNLETVSQPRLHAGGLVLEPGESRYAEFPLDWGEEWMFGRVVDPGGEPVPRARITLQWTMHYADVTSSSHRQAVTDIGGFFTMTNLGAHDYQITIQSPGHRTRRLTRSPGSGEFEVVLEPVVTALAGVRP